MFVFKAAVVGAGTMGGEIAQVIAAAGVPVILKDIDQRFVDQGLARAEEVTRGQLGRLRRPRGSSPQRRPSPGRGDPRPDHPGPVLRRLRRRRLRDRGRARAAGGQAGGLRRARRGDARPRDPRLEHLLAADHRDRPGDVPARQGGRPALLLSGIDDAAGRGRARRAHVGRDRGRAPSTSSRRFARRRSAAPTRPGSSSTGFSSRACRSCGAPRRSGASFEDLDAARRHRLPPIGPFRLGDLLGLDTVLHVAEYLADSYGERFYVTEGWPSSSPPASSGPRPGGASMSTAKPGPAGRRARRRCSSSG